MIVLELDRSSRIGLAMAGFLAPVVLGLLLRLAGGVGVVEEAVAPLRVEVCDARRLDTACGGGGMCVAGVCRAHESAPRVARGGDCAKGGLCEAGLECHLGSCSPTEELPVADATCRRPGVREVVESLKNYCADASATDLAEVGLLACRDDEWEAIARADRDFDGRVLTIPGAFAVFFPTGEPRGRFPSPTQGAHYAAQIAEQEVLVGALKDAKVVMVIGRASVTGNEADNLGLARRRAKVAEGIVRDALGASWVADVRRWGLADELPLSIDAMSAFLERPVAANEDEARALREWSESRRDHHSGMRAWDGLNQVALVVPFPCDGREFFPKSAYFDPASAR